MSIQMLNRGALAHAAIPATMGFVASAIAIHIKPSIALRWTATEAAAFIFAFSILNTATKVCANKFFQQESRPHKINTHLLPPLMAIAACATLGATIAKTNALIGVYYFVTAGYEAFEPHHLFSQRTFGHA